MPSSKITLTTLKKYLKERSKEELIADIAEFYQKASLVKDYYQLKLFPGDETEMVAKYKKVIEDQFFPARGHGRAKLSVAKKAISDYKKVCQSDESIIDIMLFYVEQGVKFTNAYGEIDENFYISMETMYEKAVEYIVKVGLKEQYQKRCQKIVSDTDRIGWGFYDMLSETYEEAF